MNEIIQVQEQVREIIASRNSQMATDYLDNQMSLAQLSKKYNLSRQRISQLFKKMGVQTRPVSSSANYRGEPKRDYNAIATRAVELGSISAAAAEFGLTKGQVNYALQKTEQNIYLQKFREPKVVAEILAAYSDGVMTLKQIGEQFGTSAQYINTILRRNGVIGGRKRGRRPKQK
jgi:DNA-directed RNA polymerase sigma subunit (sigma70/sigma32)